MHFSMPSSYRFGPGQFLVVLDIARVVLLLLGAATARVLGGDALAAEETVLADGDAESFEVSHQTVAPFWVLRVGVSPPGCSAS
jgi:hypothetical protein